MVYGKSGTIGQRYSPIMTIEKGMFEQTIFYPPQLFGNYIFETSLNVFKDCEKNGTELFFNSHDQRSTQSKGVPNLDVSATKSEGEIDSCILNRNKEKAITTVIILQNGSFTDSCKVFDINGKDVKLENNLGKNEVLTKEYPSVKSNSEKINNSFPPHSFSIIKGRIKK